MASRDPPRRIGAVTSDGLVTKRFPKKATQAILAIALRLNAEPTGFISPTRKVIAK